MDELESIDFDSEIPIQLLYEEEEDVNNIIKVTEDELADLIGGDDEDVIQEITRIPPIIFVDNEESTCISDIAETKSDNPKKSPVKPPTRQSPRKKPSTVCGQCNKVFKRVHFFTEHVKACTKLSGKKKKEKGIN